MIDQRPTYQFPTADAPPIPTVRSMRQDWLALSVQERLAVAACCAGDLPLAAVSVRGQQYLRRHHKGAE